MEGRWIEIHYHILPGVDDGAPDLETSLAMAQQAAAEGIATIVATPHTPWAGARLRQRTAAGFSPLCRELTQAMRSHGLELEVLPGVEVMLTPEVPRALDEGAELTLAGSRTILLELPVEDFPQFTEQVVFELQLRGYRVVLAHPERNLPIQRQPDLFRRLVERGVLGQLTSRSLLGAHGEEARRTAFRLLEHGLAQVISSDVHHVGPGRPGLQRALEVAAEVVGRERAWAMASRIPAQLLADEEIALPEPRPPGVGGRRWGARR